MIGRSLISSRPKTSCNHGKRVGIIALAGIEDARNAVDVAEVQLVVFVFCTAGGQNHGVFRQRLCKIRVIAAALCTAVTSSHDNEFFDRAGFHGIDDLVCQGEIMAISDGTTNHL